MSLHLHEELLTPLARSALDVHLPAYNCTTTEPDILGQECFSSATMALSLSYSRRNTDVARKFE